LSLYQKRREKNDYEHSRSYETGNAVPY